MADPILRLEPARLGVEPGGQGTLTLTVTNPGTIVEGYSVDVVSTIPVPWVEVNPPTLSVYPQQEATAVIVFAPPSGPGAPGGTFPFGVRVWSTIEGGGSAVAEGDLDIGSVSGLQAKLTPIASTGRWSGRHTLKVSNWGNAPAHLRLAPEDPGQALGFLISPEVLDVPLGGEALARVKVRTRHPTLRGSAERLPFQIACEPDGAGQPGGPVPVGSTAERPVVDGAFNQKPILTRMVVALAGLALVAVVGAIVFIVNQDDGDDRSAEESQQADQPTGFDAVAAAGIVTLSWDKAIGVTSYKLKQTAPEDDESAIVDSPVADNPARLQSRIRVETEDDYCYRLIAVVDGAPESAPSEERCLTITLPSTAPPGPTESPTIVPMSPAPTEDASPSGESPSGGSPSSGSPTSEVSTPGPFIEVLRFIPFEGSTEAEAEAVIEQDRLALVAQGFEAEVLLSDEWLLTPPLDKPSAVLYVDGPDASAAHTACEAVRAAAPALVDTGCIQPYAVSPKPSPSATPSATPLATPLATP